MIRHFAHLLLPFPLCLILCTILVIDTSQHDIIQLWVIQDHPLVTELYASW